MSTKFSKQLETITNGKLELNSETLMDIGLLLQHLGCELAILSRSEQHKETQELAKVSESSGGRFQCGFFGRKYQEHFGINPNSNRKQYQREYVYYRRHGKCHWE